MPKSTERMTQPDSKCSIRLLMDMDDVDGTFHRMLAEGRSSLRFFLGDRQRRASLFTGNLVDDRVFVASLNGRPAGYLCFQWQGRGPYRPALADFRRCFGRLWGELRWLAFHFFERRTYPLGFYVYGLKVSRWARRHGVASALMQAAEAHARGLSARRISLEVHCDNQPAIRFYEHCGFHVEKIHVFRWLKPLFGVSGFVRLVRDIDDVAGGLN